MPRLSVETRWACRAIIKHDHDAEPEFGSSSSHLIIPSAPSLETIRVSAIAISYT